MIESAKEPLTKRQAQVLAWIEESIVNRGIAPSIPELMQLLGSKSPTAAADHLKALERKGYIERMPGTARGLRLKTTTKTTAASNDEWNIPLVGKVAAGGPIAAIENVEREISIPPDLFNKRPDYLLRVQGDSMVDAGILDGDLIAVKKTQTANRGEIVVARMEDEVTVKELAIEDGEVVLLPHNSAYEPIRIPPDQVFIEGIYVGLLRN